MRENKGDFSRNKIKRRKESSEQCQPIYTDTLEHKFAIISPDNLIHTLIESKREKNCNLRVFFFAHFLGRLFISFPGNGLQNNELNLSDGKFRVKGDIDKLQMGYQPMDRSIFFFKNQIYTTQ